MNNVSVFLASVLSSGVVAGIISFSFSEAKERWILRRSKIEEIYLSAVPWLTFVSNDSLLSLRVCKGTLTYDQMLDLRLKRGSASIGDHHIKMQMNIRMYELSLVPALDSMETELRKLNKLTFAIRDCYEKTGLASEFSDPLNRQLAQFDAASEALKTAIILRGIAIGSEKGQLAQAFSRSRLALIGYKSRLSAKFRRSATVNKP
jgi:hypothetical protein